MPTSLIKTAHGARTSRQDWLKQLQSDLGSAWRRGRRVFVEQYREQLESANATDAEHLVLIEAEILVRREIGDRLTHDEYRERFPRFTAALARHFEDSVTQFVLGPRSNATKPMAATTVPGYELLEVLGRGGMGIVYKARQRGLNRLVALKMILTGRFAGDEELARFRREAEAVGALDHPHIVRVYEVGEHEGTPFISLEYVSGGTLATVLKNRALLPRDAALIAEAIARAAHEAHLHGIVHRDLKPANILLEIRSNDRTTQHMPAHTKAPMTHPSVPCASIGSPKLTDFGIAKRLNDTQALTASGVAAGTPQYMSPEQAAGKKHQPINGLADVYSIGVILYEMLTQHTPFEGESPVEILQRVCSQNPAPPTRYNPKIPRDLETIILKCLQKNPAHRYPSALALADELARWLAGKPIVARPVGKLEQGWRWCQRNRLVAGLLAGLFVTMFVGLVVSTLFAWTAHRNALAAQHDKHIAEIAQAEARANAEQALANALLAEQNAQQTKSYAFRAKWSEIGAKLNAEKARAAQQVEAQLRTEATQREQLRGRELYAADMLVAYSDWQAGNLANTEQLLNKYRPKNGHDPRGFEWHYIRSLTMAYETVYNRVRLEHCTAIPQSNSWALVANDHVVVCDPVAQRVVGRYAFPSAFGQLRSVVYAPDAQLVVGLFDGKALALREQATGKIRHQLKLDPLVDVQPQRACFAPDGKRLYVAASAPSFLRRPSLIVAYDVATGQEVQRYQGATSAVSGLTLTPDGKHLVAAVHNGSVHRWDVATGTEEHVFRVPELVLTQATHASKGNLLAVGTGRGTVLILDSRDLTLQRELRGHTDWVHTLSFAVDGTTLASAATEGIVRVWDASTGEERRRCIGHVDRITGVAFSTQSMQLVSVSHDKTALLWDIQHNPTVTSLGSRVPHLLRVLPLPDSNQALVLTAWASYYRLDLRTKQLSPETIIKDLTTNAYDGCVAPDGKTLAICTQHAGVRLVPLDDPMGGGRELRVNGTHPYRAEYSPDGKTLLVAWADGSLVAYPTDHIDQPRTLVKFRQMLTSIRFPNGNSAQFVTTGNDQTVRVWNLPTGTEQLAVQYEDCKPQWANYTPDGRSMAVACNDGVIRLHDVATGRLLRQFRGHTANAAHVAFDRYGRRMVTSSDDLTVRVWDVETGMTTLILRGHVRQIRSAMFSPDERLLVSVGDGPVKLWDAHRAHDDDEGRRLAASTILGQAQATVVNGMLRGSVNVANVTGQPLPIPHSARPMFGLRLYLAVERLGDDPTIPAYGRKPDDYDQYPLGSSRFLPPEQVLDVGQHCEVKINLSVAGWPPGKYRLHLEHGWPGADRVSVGQTTCIVVVPEP